MGYENVYYQQPWTPSGDMRQQMNLGLDSLGKVSMANAQLQAQEQANKDAAYTSPSAPASPHRAFLGQHVLNTLKSTPGHNPEFEQRFMSEAGQGGLSAPQGQYMPDGNMVQQVPQAQPQPQYQPYQPGGYNAQAPSLDNARPVPVDTTPMMGQGGEPTRHTHSTMTETTRRTPLPANRAFAMERNQPDPTGPMTNYDVDSYMRAGSTMARPNMDREKLEEKKREFDAMMDYRGRALQAKERLGRLAADAKVAATDNDRKRAIELLRIEVDREKAGVLAQAKVYSGLYGIVNEQGTQSYLNYLDSFIADAESGATSAETQPSTQPIQTMVEGAKKAKPKPRPLNQGAPSEYEVGKTYDMTGPEFPEDWKGKARFKGYDAQKNARWGRP